LNLGEFASPLGADVLAAGGAGLQQIQTAFELRVSGAGGVRRALAHSRMLRAIRGSPVERVSVLGCGSPLPLLPSAVRAASLQKPGSRIFQLRRCGILAVARICRPGGAWFLVQFVSCKYDPPPVQAWIPTVFCRLHGGQRVLPVGMAKRQFYSWQSALGQGVV